jgi:hypothetical protein
MQRRMSLRIACQTEKSAPNGTRRFLLSKYQSKIAFNLQRHCFDSGNLTFLKFDSLILSLLFSAHIISRINIDANLFRFLCARRNPGTQNCRLRPTACFETLNPRT